MYEQGPGIFQRMMQAYQFAQMIKQGRWAEEDRQRSIQQQQRDNSRQDVREQLLLNQAGAQRAAPDAVESALDGTLGPVTDPRMAVQTGQGKFYLPTQAETSARDLKEYAEKLRTQQRVGGEDDVEITLPDPVAKLIGVPKLKVPPTHVAAITNQIDAIVNPPLHPYVNTNQYGDVTPMGVNPRTMETKVGKTVYGAGKPLAANASGKVNAPKMSAHDLDTQAEANVIGAAQKKYGEKLMLEPAEVGNALQAIKKEHPEFNDQDAREYLMRVGSRLPQYKGLFENGRLRQEDYRKSAQYRKDVLNERIRLRQQFEKQTTKAAGPSAQQRQQADEALNAAIERVNQSKLPENKKQAAIRELQRAHQSRWK